MVAPLTLIMAFRAATRIYQAGDTSLAQKFRNDDVRFLTNPILDFDDLISVAGLEQLYDQDEDFRNWIAKNDLTGVYATMIAEGPNFEQAWFTIVQSYKAYELSQATGGDAATVVYAAELSVIKQWAEENKPISPLTRFAISLADVAAEFIAVNPTLLVKGGIGEKLVGSFASQISNFIPDDGDFGGRHRLGSRVGGMLLRASLGAVSEHKELLSSEAHRQKLIGALTGPLLAKFPKDQSLDDELSWERVLDDFGEDTLTAVLAVIVENQQAFLGDKFVSGTLLGELNAQFLTHLKDRGPGKAFSEEGAIALYRAALGVIAEQPELVAPGEDESKQFVQDLIGNFASALAEEHLISEGDKKDFGVALSVAALEAFKGHADKILKLGERPLEKIASDTLHDVLEALTEGLTSGERLDKVFGKQKVLELVQDVIGAVAEHPDLLKDQEELKAVLGALGQTVTAGHLGKSFVPELMRGILEEMAQNPVLLANKGELKGILGAIASAIPEDVEKRLEPQQWNAIISAILVQAAKNPGRLFRLEETDPKNEIAIVAIKTLLEGASKAVVGDRSKGGVLFGETLQLAIENTLAAITSNPARAAEIFGVGEDDLNLVAVFIEQISRVTSIRPDGVHFAMGSKEWMRLYRAILYRLLAEVDTPILVDEQTGALTPEGEKLVKDILTTIVPVGG